MSSFASYIAGSVMWLLHTGTSRWWCSNDISCSSDVESKIMIMTLEKTDQCNRQNLFWCNTAITFSPLLHFLCDVFDRCEEIFDLKGGPFVTTGGRETQRRWGHVTELRSSSRRSERWSELTDCSTDHMMMIMLSRSEIKDVKTPLSVVYFPLTCPM